MVVDLSFGLGQQVEDWWEAQPIGNLWWFLSTEWHVHHGSKGSEDTGVHRMGKKPSQDPVPTIQAQGSNHGTSAPWISNDIIGTRWVGVVSVGDSSSEW